ncbi:hypothetical protein CL634_07735 [bacterium]|nr:hypothetical protein [bacterium]|tara:strand:+ start:1694 stop:1909 length:216 start_codon:yes stop_codon:yes gene_type:complete
MTSYREAIQKKLENGGYEEFKSLCVAAIYRPGVNQTFYQVHWDAYRQPFSKLYDNIEEAMDKFFELRKRVR